MDVRKIDVPETNLAQLYEESFGNCVDICALCGDPVTNERGYDHMVVPAAVTAPPNFDGYESGYNDGYKSGYRDGHYSGVNFYTYGPATASNSHWLWFSFGALLGCSVLALLLQHAGKGRK